MSSLEEVIQILKMNPTSDVLDGLNSITGYTPLMDAITANRQEDIDFLLSQKANVHVNVFGNSAILMACKQNNPELVIQLVNCGANVNDTTNNNMTPLMIAIMRKYDRLVDTLLSLGASVNSMSIYGSTPLYMAVNENSMACVMMLLTYGADPYKETISKPCAAELAIEFNYSECLYEMVQQTDLIHQPVWPKLLDRAIQRKCTPCFMELLHKNMEDDLLNRLLFYSIEKVYYEGVQLLFQYGANPNCTDLCKRTPILWAANFHNKELFNLCIEYGADINKSRPSVLNILCRHGDIAFVKYALSKGADVNSMIMNSTPLMEAARYGNDGVIHMLIQHGANVSCMNIYKETAANIALYHYHYSCHQLLTEVMRLNQLLYPHDMLTEMIHVNIPCETWYHSLSKEARHKAMDTILSVRQDEIACFVALFEGEDRLLKKFREGEEVAFSESWLRGFVRPSGNRMFRKRLMKYMVHPHEVRHTLRLLAPCFSG
jgi:ankyrin repeat protein